MSQSPPEDGLTLDAKSTTLKPELPPEDPATLRTRRWIILSFWVVVAFLGFPYWLWTTSIHRAQLPLDALNKWAEGRACRIEYPLQILLQSTTLDPGQFESLATEIESTLPMVLQASGNFRLFEFYVNATADRIATAPHHDGETTYSTSTADTQSEVALTLAFEPGALGRNMSHAWRPLTRVLDISFDRDDPDLSALADYAVDMILLTFQDEHDSLSHLLHDTPFAAAHKRLAVPTKDRLEARTTRAFKYAATYHLTFSLFTATAWPSDWDVEPAIQQFITPLIAALSGISNFTLETQVQLHASISPSISGPHFDGERWQLQTSDLSGFVNAAEWPLNPSIGAGPTINFVLYVPSPDQTPLVIAQSEENSWLLPQWGGVQILNPDGNETDPLGGERLERVMLRFADQLIRLVGMPSTPPSLALRVASLTRERATSLILSASSTLGALARLTLKLTSIAIPDTVAVSVDQTIHHLDQACLNLRNGRYESALHHARIAEAEAEKAFFEPSMVGQVYFPDEHKVAVYVPLLGPMAVPLVLAGIKELRGLRAGKQKTA